MTINDNMTEFMGRSIEDFQGPLASPARVAYRIGLNDPGQVLAQLQLLLQDPNASQLQGLIVSSWAEISDQDPSKLLGALIDAKETLKELKTFFLGDMTYMQCEVSWIKQCDVSPFLSAYPGLLHFGLRGGDGLAFSKIKHENLRSLIVETGGLRAKTIQQICALELPALEHLELWLGLDEYGGDAKVEDLATIFAGDLFPHIKRLGLRNSMFTDEICKALLDAPVLTQLSHLDLSMGTLSDEGAAYLLENPHLKNIEALDLRHHYLSDEMQKRLKDELIGVEVSVDNPQNPSEDRYCVVTE